MLNYMIYAHIPTITLVFRDFTDFDFVSQIMWVEWRFLRLCGLKKIEKEAQRHPTVQHRPIMVN